jgi:hypothetical protein
METSIPNFIMLITLSDKHDGNTRDKKKQKQLSTFIPQTDS